MTTDYHAKYWANLLKAQTSTTSDVMAAVSSARVDLNPHQVEAASFVLRSPLSNGVVLADEVGLGKTIEAGLVLLQLWARRKRRLLIVAPATLRRQWASELSEKFGLPARVLDADSYGGKGNPFDDDRSVLICSYHFAARHQGDVQMVAWDRIVFDEAHQLRNVWKSQNQRAKALARATRHAPKLLLTATPLQNSLMELYGLVQIIDEHVFGGQKTFRSAYSSAATDARTMLELKARLQPLVKRTLRRQVREYVKFTSRIPITQDFTPSDDEQALYDLVSEYLQQDDSYALPKAQRTLMTLILRKILASSSVAIAATLENMAAKLEGQVRRLSGEKSDGGTRHSEAEDLAEELEIDEDYDGELEESRGVEFVDSEFAGDVAGRRSEASQLRQFADLAHSIQLDAKAKSLIEILPKALAMAQERGAQEKAVIFTESRRTQHHLVELLEATGYAGKVITINGQNTEAQVQAVYSKWRAKRLEAGLAVANRVSDTKSAIVDAFRDDYPILVATEAAAEGLNLQFCSLVVNFDLPWNPQRIEQRIGRCHRYGQKHDVVVVNFLNTSNEADKRVFELLDEKFKLFSGVFGASDEVLGALASGFDLEKRIGAVYQTCRTAQEIEEQFDKLRSELETEIESKMDSTKATLLEDFDDEVIERLDVQLGESKRSLGLQQAALWFLTQHELQQAAGAAAVFDRDQLLFELDGDEHPGRYVMDWARADELRATFYHHLSPLAELLSARAAARQLPESEVVFDYSSHGSTVGALEQLRGKSGLMAAQLVTAESADSVLELILTGVTDGGDVLDGEQLARMFSLQAAELGRALAPGEVRSVLAKHINGDVKAFEMAQRERLDVLLSEESEKLDRWADDLRQGLELELKEIEKTLKEAGREARQSAGMGIQEKLLAQRKKQELERKRNQKRRELYEEQDRIDARRDELLSEVEAKLAAKVMVEDLFAIRWTLA
ncbi:helicase-like protein [Arthrobacter sp. SLBN-122]|nr:helicase-like protein [Arthrobacter sp. SLBN-122]